MSTTYPEDGFRFTQVPPGPAALCNDPVEYKTRTGAKGQAGHKPVRDRTATGFLQSTAVMRTYSERLIGDQDLTKVLVARGGL
jgi:hypothetical protein